MAPSVVPVVHPFLGLIAIFFHCIVTSIYLRILCFFRCVDLEATKPFP